MGTPTPTPLAAPTLLNLSTRGHAGSGENVLIGGFILGPGDGSKRILVRAIGPSLASAGVTGALADPSLQLVDSTGQVVAANDDWMNGGQMEAIIATTLAPNDQRESALIAPLLPGAYTAIVNGTESTNNIALVEAFDLDGFYPPQLVNLSTRGQVDFGEGVMIAGTIIGGTEPETLLFRGLGPSLAQLSNPLPDPTLTLVDGQGTTLSVNDNWQDSQATEIGQTGLAPADALESALLVTLAPGSYTALLSDVHGSPGTGLFEIYHLDSSQSRGGH